MSPGDLYAQASLIFKIFMCKVHGNNLLTSGYEMISVCILR